ncbi:Flp pilus assembly protein CpaB [Pseudidiomarina taiwanensis]|uniref:SAF domain-containing protein n=1 Tax=Pseudidiomarina taiwanensis TaxID=337250 RepID=A0A432ZCA7_9GAMM|nr:SAF domain-containing protein [Pseudidiomarina taiwanensis]RUO75530.1 hypothetical protein CWI83_10390 [Pseudidiomarina taiwanensis]
MQKQFVKPLLFIVAFIITSATGYLLLQKLTQQRQTDFINAQQQQMIPVLVAATPIEVGTALELELLQQRNYPPNYIADTWLLPSDAHVVVGLTAQEYIDAGQPLQLSLLAAPQQQDLLPLQANQVAVTATITMEQLIGGLLRVGDHVVLRAQRLGQSALTLDDIEIIALDANTGATASGSEHEIFASTVTFAMTASQASEFELMRDYGFRLWLKSHSAEPLPEHFAQQTQIHRLGATQP